MTTDSGAPDAERELPKPEPVGVTPPDGLLLALTTIGSRDEAEAIARTLLDERLVACANLLPGCRSVYRWQGVVEDAEETLVIFKTARNRYRAFEERLRALHPYELPEIVALSPDAALPAYAAWVIGETRRRLAR
jgi:periplasmic divalent cation tolerance protein